MRRAAIVLLASAAAALQWPVASLAASTAGAASASPAVQPTTPPGITMIEVVKDKGGGQPVFLWFRPGDANGRTLFASEADRSGVSSCTAECAREHPPLLAAAGAKPFGDWSLVRRADGDQQWAYQTRPLYTWVREKEPGEVATNVGVAETSGIPDISAAFADTPGAVPPLTPEPGWRVVRFTPETSLDLPDGIAARMVPSAQGLALTDIRGITL